MKTTLRNPAIAGPAILAWAVRGCLAWQQERLNVPQVIKAATSAYRTDMDPLKDFWSDWIFDPAAWTPANALWNAYQVWAEANGERAITRTKFGARLSARGCVATKERGVRGWRGIKLAEDAKIGAHDLTLADLEVSA